MTVLQNYVILEPGIPARLHFVDHVIQTRTITDSQTGKPSSRQVLVFDVDEVDGAPTVSKFSTMAEKLASKLGPYLPTKSYTAFNFTITQNGTGFQTSWSVLATPRT